MLKVDPFKLDSLKNKAFSKKKKVVFYIFADRVNLFSIRSRMNSSILIDFLRN